MAKTTTRQFMESAFTGLLGAAQKTISDYKLTTSPLPKDRQESQYNRITTLHSSIPDKLYLHGGGFILRFKCADEHYLALSIEHLSSTEKFESSEFLATKGLVEHELEECFFLYLRFHLGPLYKLKSSRRSREAALDILDISEAAGYTGHDINDLIEYHEAIQCYKIDADSLFSNGDIWMIAASLAANIPNYRSALLSDEIAAQIESVSHSAVELSENTYTALTSVHWKYIFFELYKCLEALFFLPWGLSAKNALGIKSSALDAHRVIQKVTSFRGKEATSIENLLSLTDDSLSAGMENSPILAFKGVTTDSIKQQLGRRIYKIRNNLVHQEDYEDREPLDLENENWPELILFMCKIINYLYSNFKIEIKESSDQILPGLTPKNPN